MPINAVELLLTLLLAHVLLDFPLQPSRWVAERYQRRWASPALYVHALLHGIAALVLFGAWTGEWRLALLAGGIVLLTHWLADLAKTCWPRASLKAFIADQFFHVLVLLLAWSLYVGPEALWGVISPLWSAQSLLVILAYLLVLLPLSVIISLCLSPWIAEIRALEQENEQHSLTKAGAMIGYLERMLILTFVLLGQYTAIGFVLAIKAAFRFKDTDDRRKAEYMMMGTFLSFSLTIVLGLAVNSLSTWL